jgi:DNA-binding transcriptional LysR family regulator
MRSGEFGELNAFMAVVQARSFRAAAQRLGVTPSALSRTIGRLEARLGMRLLNRTTRSVSPTEAGLALQGRLEPILTDLEQAVSDTAAMQDSAVGNLRLNLPRLAADLVLAPLLARFGERHPGIRLELTIDDGLSDVVAEGFDAGIRIGERLARDMIAIRLTPDYRNAVAASPAYFTGRSRPETPHDLRSHACLNYRWSATGQLYRWPFLGPNGPLEVDVDGPLVVNDTAVIRDAAVRGLGLACLPEAYFAAQLESGALVRVLERWCRPFPGFYLYHPSRHRTPTTLRALIDFLQDQRTLT